VIVSVCLCVHIVDVLVPPCCVRPVSESLGPVCIYVCKYMCCSIVSIDTIYTCVSVCMCVCVCVCVCVCG
jgi:hypothetical protein